MAVHQSVGVTIARGRAATNSKQGLLISDGVSAETCKSQAIWMGLVTFQPGARAKAHLHENHETALYILQGQGEMWYGDQLEEHLTFEAGDFIYIPAGMPHAPLNTSQTEPILVVATRTDPNEQESVVLLPELEKSAS
jgi:uncharacterized RmlC-like cupin family protein